MSEHSGTVVGIDVGGESKGFHAVALVDGKFAYMRADRDPVAIVDWCLHHKAEMVGVESGEGEARLSYFVSLARSVANGSWLEKANRGYEVCFLEQGSVEGGKSIGILA
jgi:hypothetical protein